MELYIKTTPRLNAVPFPIDVRRISILAGRLQLVVSSDEFSTRVTCNAENCLLRPGHIIRLCYYDVGSFECDFDVKYATQKFSTKNASSCETFAIDRDELRNPQSIHHILSREYKCKFYSKCANNTNKFRSLCWTAPNNTDWHVFSTTRIDEWMMRECIERRSSVGHDRIWSFAGIQWIPQNEFYCLQTATKISFL